MGFGKIFDETTERGMWELTHDHVFAKNGEAWYRDFEREISARDLMREICSKHISRAYSEKMGNDTLDELLADGFQHGTDSIDGVISLCYMILCEAADMRAYLDLEKNALPTTIRPEVLRQAVDTRTSREKDLGQVMGMEKNS